MILGYNTNGFAHHDLNDALEILAETGYRGIALTPDVHHLPFDDFQHDAIEHYSLVMEQLDLTCVIESGARFLLNPYHKHQPTLLASAESDRQLRRHLLEDHIDLAHDLQAPVMSLWSGTPLNNDPPDLLMARLAEECLALCDYASKRRVKLAFEPEPGMFIDTMAKFEELFDRVNHPSFGLTLDVGHLVCLNESPITSHIRKWNRVLWNIHLDDMRHGTHDHLYFGEGDVIFPDLFRELHAIGYQGMASVELSRHSFDAVNVARKAFEFLKPFCHS